MSNLRPPRGITPPTPGLEREEPTFVPEEDIPPDDGQANGSDEREDRAPAPHPERE